MLDILGWVLPPLCILVALGLLVWNHLNWLKWYKHPDTVRERQKEAYEAAHAYTGGICPDKD